jgi:L-lactate dehydrogenase (cytochrome)
MRSVTIEDLRRIARRRLPRMVFDYVDGGAYDELTLRANRADFERLRFRPRALVDVSERDLSAVLFGTRLALPLVLAPIGLAGLVARRGEVQAARAAEAAGIPFCLSTASVCSIEEVRAATVKPFWFQLYMGKDRELARSLIDRARAAGCSALAFTVDVPVAGQRERDLRNGFTVPPRITPANALDTARRWRWMRDVLLGSRLTLGNVPHSRSEGFLPLARLMLRNHDASKTWREFEWVRSLWPGPLLVKGVLTPEDARLAVAHGADGVVVSNHGGRQLDGAPSSISVLPSIVEAVAGQATILLDGGIRRGQDVLKALALGAHACLIGRAFVYGLAAGGEAGVRRAIEILAGEMDTTLALLGRRSLAELDGSALEPVERPVPTGAGR